MNMPRQIAMQAPRTFEDFRLAGASPERLREIGVVNTAYDSILASDFTYVSTPITSGAALYQAMEVAGVGSVDELRQDPEAFKRLVIEPNFAAADAVSQAMLSFGGAVIAPAAFEARALGWDQDAYMGLWLDTIERKATRIALVDGWEYSNGGAEEYLQALLMQSGRRDRSNIDIVDARGRVLPHHEALELLATAVDSLMSRSYRPVTLATVLNRAMVLHVMIDEQGRYGQTSDRSGRTIYNVGNGYHEGFDHQALPEALRHVRVVRDATMDMLPDAERHISSSLAMAPGLVRRDDIEGLSTSRAKLKSAKPRD